MSASPAPTSGPRQVLEFQFDSPVEDRKTFVKSLKCAEGIGDAILFGVQMFFWDTEDQSLFGTPKFFFSGYKCSFRDDLNFLEGWKRRGWVQLSAPESSRKQARSSSTNNRRKQRKQHNQYKQQQRCIVGVFLVEFPSCFRCFFFDAGIFFASGS